MTRDEEIHQFNAVIHNVDTLSRAARENLQDWMVVLRYQTPQGLVQQMQYFFWEKSPLPRQEVTIPGGLAFRAGDGRRVGRAGDIQVFADVAPAILTRLHREMIQESGKHQNVLMGTEEHDRKYDRGRFLAYVAVKEGHAVALLTGHDGRDPQSLLVAVDQKLRLRKDRCLVVPGHPPFTLDTLWIAPDHRRRGLGPDLIRWVASVHDLPVDQMGYGLPFTPGGFRTVARTVGGNFLGSGTGVGAFSVRPIAEKKMLRPHRVIPVPALPGPFPDSLRGLHVS